MRTNFENGLKCRLLSFLRTNPCELKTNLIKPFFAVAVFAVSIVSLSAGNILLKIGMDRFGALTASGIPVAQALIAENRILKLKSKVSG